MIQVAKYTPEIKEKPHGPLLMTGPKMPGIVAENKYNVVPDRVPTAAARYVKPITLKFKINPKIPVLHVVNTIPTNFQSKILSPGVMAAI